MWQPRQRTHPLSGIAHRNLSSNVRPRACPCGSHVKARRTVDAIPVQQRHRRHIQLRAACHQQLRQRCAFEKTECRAGMKFYVHRHPHRFQISRKFQARTSPRLRPEVHPLARTRQRPGRAPDGDSAAAVSCTRGFPRYLAHHHNVPLFPAPARMHPPSSARAPGARAPLHRKPLSLQQTNLPEPLRSSRCPPPAAAASSAATT